MHSHVAFIREDMCIGCTKCIDVCPTDAIIGAKNMSHTVVRDLCIACDLCLPPCPVNCIDLISVDKDPATQKARALEAKIRIQARLQRLALAESEKQLAENKLRAKTPEERKEEINRARCRGE